MNQLTSRCACSGLSPGPLPVLPEETRSIAEVFKAMGHPTRLTLINALQEGERCVCELAPLVPGELSTISRHLSILKHAGIIEDRREGQRIYYHLRLDCVSGFTACASARLRELKTGE